MPGITIIDNDNVLDNNEFNMQEQSLLIALISYYNKEKGYAYPSYKQLKLRCKLKDNRTLIKTMDSLIKKGYLTKETLKGIGVRYFISKCNIAPSGNLHQVENSTKCKTTPTPSGDLHHDLVENYTTTNTNTNTNTKTNNNNNKKGYDKIINSYTQNQDLKTAILEFIKMRKAIRKPLTDRALQLMLKNLDKLANDEATKIEILNQSIVNCWQGVFQIKDKQPTAADASNSSWDNLNKFD